MDMVEALTCPLSLMSWVQKFSFNDILIPSTCMRTMSIKYKYFCSKNARNFVNASWWKEKYNVVLKDQNNFVLKDTLDSQNYKIIPVRILESFKAYPLLDEAVYNKHCVIKIKLHFETLLKYKGVSKSFRISSVASQQKAAQGCTRSYSDLQSW
jgi:hypothetical protein